MALLLFFTSTLTENPCFKSPISLVTSMVYGYLEPELPPAAAAALAASPLF